MTSKLIDYAKEYFLDIMVDDDDIELSPNDVEINKEFIDFINEFKSDLIFDFLNDMIDDKGKEIIIDVSEKENNLLIELEIIEQEEEKKSDDKLEAIDWHSIRQALMSGNFNKATELFVSQDTEDKTTIYAEKETAFFNYKLPFKCNSVDDIDIIDKELEKCIISINDAIKSENYFQF